MPAGTGGGGLLCLWMGRGAGRVGELEQGLSQWQSSVLWSLGAAHQQDTLGDAPNPQQRTLGFGPSARGLPKASVSPDASRERAVHKTQVGQAAGRTWQAWRAGAGPWWDVAEAGVGPSSGLRLVTLAPLHNGCARLQRSASGGWGRTGKGLRASLLSVDRAWQGASLAVCAGRHVLCLQ